MKYYTFTVEVSEGAAPQMLRILRGLKAMGGMGCTRMILAEDFGELGEFDGDGNHKIRNIWINDIPDCTFQDLVAGPNGASSGQLSAQRPGGEEKKL